MGISMKNDLDLIRKILESVERKQDAEADLVEIAGWPESTVARHVERLCDDGFLDHAPTPAPGDDDTPDYYVRDLTSAGHELLNALRSGDVVQRLKNTLKPSELGALSLRKLAVIIGDLAEQAIRKKLGL